MNTNLDVDVDVNIELLRRIFPCILSTGEMRNLKIDNESLKYISLKEDASYISRVISSAADKIKLSSNKIIVTDCLAGVGGNSISFCRNFSKVYSIEIDKLRHSMLVNNLDIYKCTTISISYNDDFINIVKNITDHNVVFLDPPWGGQSYKDVKKLRLNIGKSSLEVVCNMLLDSSQMIKIPEIIILKLPKNYDICYFYNNLKNKNIYYYDLKKMIILVIYYKEKK